MGYCIRIAGHEYTKEEIFSSFGDLFKKEEQEPEVTLFDKVKEDIDKRDITDDTQVFQIGDEVYIISPSNGFKVEKASFDSVKGETNKKIVYTKVKGKEANPVIKEYYNKNRLDTYEKDGVKYFYLEGSEQRLYGLDEKGEFKDINLSKKNEYYQDILNHLGKALPVQNSYVEAKEVALKFKELFEKNDIDGIIDLLDNIIKNNKIERLRGVFERVKSILKERGITTDTQTAIKDGVPAIQKDGVDKNLVSFNYDFFTKGNFISFDNTTSVETLAEVLVHEMIHATIVKETKEVMRGVRDDKNISAIISLFEKYQKNFQKHVARYNELKEKDAKGIELTYEEELEYQDLRAFQYSASNINEFITMGLTNNLFKKRLKQNSFWKEFFEAVKRFLGLTTNNSDFEYLYQNYSQYIEARKKEYDEKRGNQGYPQNENLVTVTYLGKEFLVDFSYEANPKITNDGNEITSLDFGVQFVNDVINLANQSKLERKGITPEYREVVYNDTKFYVNDKNFNVKDINGNDIIDEVSKNIVLIKYAKLINGLDYQSNKKFYTYYPKKHRIFIFFKIGDKYINLLNNKSVTKENDPELFNILENTPEERKEISKDVKSHTQNKATEFKRANSNMIFFDEDNDYTVFNHNRPTFTYNGVSINTKDNLTDEQKEALQKIIDLLSSKEKVIQIVGQGGTGKTSLIKYAFKYLSAKSNRNIVPQYVAPTIKAGMVLTEETEQKTHTLQSLFSGDIANPTQYRLSEKGVNLLNNSSVDDVLVIDESSMIEDATVQLILKEISKSNNRVKVIFMGDEHQFAPIRNKIEDNVKQTSMSLSPNLTENTQKGVSRVELKKSQRAENEILASKVEKVRNGENKNLPNPKESDKGVYEKVDTKADLVFNFVQEKQKNNGETNIIITYNNALVTKYNNDVRVAMGYKTDEVNVDEDISGGSGLVGTRTKPNESMGNSTSYKLKEKGKITTIVGKEVHAEKWISQSQSKNGNTVESYYFPMSFGDYKVMGDNTTSEDIEKNKKFVKYYMERILKFKEREADINSNNMSRADKIVALDALKNEYAEDFKMAGKINLSKPVILINGKIEIYDDKNKEHVNKKLENFYNVMNEGFSFNYAINVNKSQGSSYDNVFFDETKDKKYGSDPIIMLDSKIIGKETNIIDYIAISRAKKKFTFVRPDFERGKSNYANDPYVRKAVMKSVDLENCF